MKNKVSPGTNDAAQRSNDQSMPATTVGGVHIRGNVGTVQSPITISGGEVHGPIIGVQTASVPGDSAAPSLLTDDDTAAQFELLDAYRQTLHVLLRQQALLGGSSYVSPGTANSIREARSEIKRIKAALRGSGQAVIDLPNDG